MSKTKKNSFYKLVESAKNERTLNEASIQTELTISELEPQKCQLPESKKNFQWHSTYFEMQFILHVLRMSIIKKVLRMKEVYWH